MAALVKREEYSHSRSFHFTSFSVRMTTVVSKTLPAIIHNQKMVQMLVDMGELGC